MGLLSKTNLDKIKGIAGKNVGKIKGLAEDNAGKIAKGVDKATDAVNKKTGGKFAGPLKKVDAAAHKFARDADRATDDEAPEAASSDQA